MTEQRASHNVNGDSINLSTGRSWLRADEAGDLTPWPDGDDMPWDGWNDDALTPDEYTLMLEAKLDDATRTIYRLREELEALGSMIVVTYVAFYVVGMAVGYVARVVQTWIW